MITLEEYYNKKNEIKEPEWLWDDDKWIQRKQWTREVYKPQIYKLQSQLSEEDLRTLIMSELRFFDRMNSEAGVEEEMDFEKEFEKIKKDLEKYR